MSVLIAMCVFSLAMSVTPGPVNLITFSTGVNHGFRKAFPFVSGATFGFTLLLTAIGAGLGNLLMHYAYILRLLGYAGAAFICYMGYKIATQGTAVTTDRKPPATFMKGAFLQWLNPKAWAACLAGVVTFQLADNYSLLLQFVSIYFVICYLAIALWAFAGSHATTFVQNPKHLKALNVLMGTGLILLAVYLQLSI